jgi:hypothetical protein
MQIKISFFQQNSIQIFFDYNKKKIRYNTSNPRNIEYLQENIFIGSFRNHFTGLNLNCTSWFDFIYGPLERVTVGITHKNDVCGRR